MGKPCLTAMTVPFTRKYMSELELPSCTMSSPSLTFMGICIMLAHLATKRGCTSTIVLKKLMSLMTFLCMKSCISVRRLLGKLFMHCLARFSKEMWCAATVVAFLHFSLSCGGRLASSMKFSS